MIDVTRPSRTPRVRLSTALLALLTAARMAPAAPDAGNPNSPQETNSPTRLPPVTVTAQKQPADLQSLPVSVTAVTPETLRDADVRLVKDAEVYAPNVFLNEFSARKLSNPFFRGIGSSPNNPGVTTYIDGVPQLNANSSNIELLDVEQIEFVRGPQAALFGRNTVGGLINITSTRPSLRDWTGNVTGNYGNYDLRDIRGSLSAPVVPDALGLGVGFGYSGRDGYTKDDATGNSVDNRDAFFGKAQLFWVPCDKWEVRLVLSGERASDGDYALNDLAQVRANPFHVSRTFDGFTHRDIIAPTLLTHYSGEKLDFDMITGAVWWKTEDFTDLDYTAAPLITRRNSEKDRQFTEELRLASSPDAAISLADNLKLKWQSGLFFFTQNYEQDAINNYSPGLLYQPGSFGGGFPPSFSPANSQHSPRSSLDDIGVGAYAQATLMAWEKLDLGIGLRGDYEQKDADLKTFFTNPDPFLGPGTTNRPNKDFADASPQFSAAWHIVPDKTVYVTVGRGFKAGGFNSASPSGSEAYNEEHSWNYEAGLKTLWLGDRLSVNIAAFYIDWQDLQLNVPNPQVPGQFYIANVGGAMSKGVELELKARPLPGLDLFGSAGYTDARFRSGTSDSGVNVSGNKLPFTPDYTANGGMQYSLAVCREVSLYARAEVTVYGNYKYNAQNTAAQSAYSLADFRAGVRGRHWFAELWIRNAFDSHYVPIAFAYPGIAPSGFVGEPGAPMTYGGRAGLNF